MEQIITNIINSFGSVVAAITGISVPPIIILIALVAAFMKGLKTLTKIACTCLVIYVLWVLGKSGIMPDVIGMFIHWIKVLVVS